MRSDAAHSAERDDRSDEYGLWCDIGLLAALSRAVRAVAPANDRPRAPAGRVCRPLPWCVVDEGRRVVGADRACVVDGWAVQHAGQPPARHDFGCRAVGADGDRLDHEVAGILLADVAAAIGEGLHRVVHRLFRTRSRRRATTCRSSAVRGGRPSSRRRSVGSRRRSVLRRSVPPRSWSSSCWSSWSWSPRSWWAGRSGRWDRRLRWWTTGGSEASVVAGSSDASSSPLHALRATTRSTAASVGLCIRHLLPPVRTQIVGEENTPPRRASSARAAWILGALSPGNRDATPPRTVGDAATGSGAIRSGRRPRRRRDG